MNYYLAHITYPILFVAVLARELSLPVPALLFLLTGGALAGRWQAEFCWNPAGCCAGKPVG
jgi:hypothetical protein